MKRKRNILLIGIFLCTFMLVCTPTTPPVQAQQYDTSPAAKIVGGAINFVGRIVADTSGMFCRGLATTGKKIEGNAFLSFPLIAMPLGIIDGLRYEVTYGEQLIGRVIDFDNTSNKALWMTTPLAQKCVDNNIYTFAKLGAATGGLLAAAYGPFAGITMIETYAVSTATGAVGGAIVGFGADTVNW